MKSRVRWRDHPLRTELLRLFAIVDALTAACSCKCTTAQGQSDARCCQFGVTGREPYPTPIELCEVNHALSARGMPRGARKESPRRLPLAARSRVCPLLSAEGRCTIYQSRPLGCRTYFCAGHEPPRSTRLAIDDVARRIADLAAVAFPRDPLPRPFTRALAGALPGAPPHTP